MKPHNDLTADYVRSILDYDPETGIFIWKSRNDAHPGTNGRYAGKLAGYRTPKNYVRIVIHQIGYMAHRLAWLLMTNEWPEFEIDHKDRNGLNNQWTNIRTATAQQNVFNRGIFRNNKSGFKGVAFHKCSGKWSAALMRDRKQQWLGLFDSPQDAHLAYCKAAEREFGEYAGSL